MKNKIVYLLMLGALMFSAQSCSSRNDSSPPATVSIVEQNAATPAEAVTLQIPFDCAVLDEQAIFAEGSNLSVNCQTCHNDLAKILDKIDMDQSPSPAEKPVNKSGLTPAEIKSLKEKLRSSGAISVNTKGAAGTNIHLRMPDSRSGSRLHWDTIG